jgi:hypothetical protein
MRLSCRESDLQVGRNPGTFVLEYSRLLPNAGGFFKKMLPDDTSFSVCSDQIESVDLTGLSIGV